MPPPEVRERSGVSRRLFIGMLTTLLIAGAIAARRRWLAVPIDESPENSIIVIVGAGVAGLSAAASALDRGARVLLIDKAPNFGGNSRKASSGVNAVNTKFQEAKGIVDNPSNFVKDIIKSGKGYSMRSIAQVLADRSGRTINHMSDYLSLEFSNINALGGHSTARTHRFEPTETDPRPFGAVLVKALTEYISSYEVKQEPASPGSSSPSNLVTNIESMFIESERGQLVALKSAQLIDFNIATRPRTLSSGGGGDSPGSRGFWSGFSSQSSQCSSPRNAEANDILPYVSNVTIKMANGQVQTLGHIKALIIASGGFGGDTVGEKSLIAQYTPQYIGFPTTNDLSTTGEVHQMAINKGLVMYELNQVQLHPTAFVNTEKPDAAVKFLCPEVLRSLGALLFNVKGERFIDELSTRDMVSQAIIEKGGLQSAWGIVKDNARIDSHSSTGTAADSPRRLNTLTDRPSSGASPRESSSSGAALKEQNLALLVFSEETAKKFGSATMKFYIKFNLIHPISHLENLTSAFTREALQSQVPGFEIAYVAFVTPAVHYTTGGILVDELMRGMVAKNSNDRFSPNQLNVDMPLLSQSDMIAVQNLFIAGEAAGGLHGHNRLGGNGMSECMVFGSLAGEMSTMVSAAPTLPLDSYPAIIQTQIISLGEYGNALPSRTLPPSPDEIEASPNQSTPPSPNGDVLGTFVVALPGLNLQLNPALSIDELIVEAWHTDKQPLKFRDVQIIESHIGFIRLSCRGNHEKLSHGDQVVFHLASG